MALTTDQVLDAIREHLEGRGLDGSKVTADANLMDDLGLDSLDSVELALGLEEKFGIEIPEAEMEDVETVSGVVELVQKKMEVKT